MPFNNLPHPEMITKSATVLQVLTPELYAYLLSLLPTPQSYGELHERYEASFAGSLKGDPEKAKACEADRKAINQDLAIILGLAKAVTHKDPTVIEKFPFSHATERTTAATLGESKDFRITFDKKGRPLAWVTRVAGAKGYEIWACEGDPGIEANWKLLVWSLTCQKIALPGLNRTKLNFLRIRGKRGNILGPWSNFVSVDPA